MSEELETAQELLVMSAKSYAHTQAGQRRCQETSLNYCACRHT